MPTSHPYQINEIIELIITINPKKLLDIGVGFGKYGFLSREYLELYDGTQNYRDWKRRIDGIEAHESYITPVHRHIYTQIHIGNALDVLPTLKDTYDLILLIDVLEHFTFEDGSKLLRACLERGRNVVVATPWDIGHQKEDFGNPYETHQFQWNPKHFKSCPHAKFIFNERSLICHMGEDASRLKHSKRSRLISAVKLLLTFLRRH